MPYTSPVALLDQQQLTDFSTTDFKKVKNALLLRFQLSDEPTIQVNGQWYDKDELVRLLEALQANPSLHFAIFQNRDLLLFLEEYELKFFQNGKAQSIVLQDTVHAKAINLLIAETINEFLPEEILTITAETKTMLWQIYLYMSRVDPEIMPLAYQDTFEVLKNFVDKLKDKYPVPYINEDDLRFHPELEHIISLEFLDFFKHLPPAFDYCRIKYCTWCNNHVVVPFGVRESQFSAWPRASLKVVMEANAIAATIFNKEGNLDNAKRIDEYLHAKSSGGGGLRIAFGIIIFIISLIRLGGSCNRMDRSDNQRYQRYDYTNQRDNYSNLTLTEEQNEKLITEIRKAMNAKKEDQIIVQPDQEENAAAHITASLFNGSKALKQEFFRIMDIRNTDGESIIFIETDIIPANTKDFLSLIPVSVKEKYADKERKIILDIQRKGLPKVRFRHEMNVLFKEPHHVYYGSARVATGRAIVKVKDTSNYSKRLKGFFTSMEVEGVVLKIDTIEVLLDASGQIQSIWYNNLEGNIGTGSQHANDLLWRRIWCAVHNLTRINGKTLFPEFAQEVDDIASYSYAISKNEGAGKTRPGSKPQLERKTEDLYFLDTSAGDGIAYFTAAQSNYDIKYMVDTQRGVVKGIQMALLSKDQSEVERIELFQID